MQKQLPVAIKTWLNNRGILDSVLDEYKISFENERIVIPVHGVHGNVLFNKYRRAPYIEEGPKYQYDKGAHCELYGRFQIPNPKIIFCLEGEMDVLCAVSHGIPAVTSTGGAGSFMPSWKEYFEGVDTFICFDNDDAGIKGAFHAQKIIPHAKIIWLPKQVGEHGDVTDYFTKLLKTKEDFYLMASLAKSYELPVDWRAAKTKAELRTYEVDYSNRANELLPQIRELASKYEGFRHLEILKEMYLSKLAEVKRAIKTYDIPKNFSGDKLARAKLVPIPRFINFNNEGFAKCVFHNEKSPSMYYYEKQNKVKCFGCDKLADVVDVVMAQQNITFTEALKIILNEK